MNVWRIWNNEGRVFSDQPPWPLLTSLAESDVRLTLMDCRVTESQIQIMDIQNKFQVWEAEHQLNREIRINAKNSNNDICILYFV